MSTINVYSLHTDGLSIETYILDLLTCEQINHRTETYKTAKARRARVATLSETHTLVSRIVHHPTAHAVAWMVREPGPVAEHAIYFNGEFVGYAPTRNDAESRINDLVYDLLTRADIAAKVAEQEAQAPKYDEDGDLLVCDECNQPIAAGGTLFAATDDSGETQVAICAACLAEFPCGDYALHNAAHALEMSLARDDHSDDADYLRELAAYDLECQYGADESAPPLDCGDLHRALSGNPDGAYRTLATLSESQLTRQAIAYSAVYGLDWWGVLKDWQDARG